MLEGNGETLTTPDTHVINEEISPQRSHGGTETSSSVSQLCNGTVFGGKKVINYCHTDTFVFGYTRSQTGLTRL